ncbi:hypothetical protein CAPTEDRAFT_93742 [Capitella teleta]|uniref:Fucosyltransferase n=1 Tax=Capitella teleta TaxID=283909 RepID=R7UQ87_CAPTE|nr:hypothetical protein CAPTEDRAFT_93742 [Capitella teleta]|eukprot:ELU08694.1 hypothetical protein CAPTEDRAFT_93742 [Capitella teleta]
MNSCYSKGILTADQACQFTKDRQRLDEADALLFRARGLEMVDLPPRRSPKQHYIVWEIEPPHKTWRFINLTQYNGFFNLTATYAWDSDIPQNEHRNWVINQEKYDSLDKVDFVAEKRSDVPVAWFVSRCPTQSKREDYVKEMQKYVNVDVYGQCGTMQCTYQGAHFKDDECVRKLLGGKNSYKFYLAFENSLCEDYATEKIWKVTDTNVIPVVMGAVDYKRMFPPKTFIDVRDFESPKDLADFLLYLNKNDTEFNEYARRKSAMKLFMVGLTGSQCSICKGLHSFIGKQSIVYSLDEFWGARRCMQPNTFLKHHDASDFGVNLRDIRTPGRPVINTTSKKTNTYNMNKH